MLAWLSAFVFTQVVECPFYLRAQARGPSGRTVGWRLVVAFGASALTHPVVWFVIPPLVYGAFPDLVRVPLWGASAAYVLMVAVAETFAWLGEALYLRLVKVERALWWSLLANAASVGLGFASRALWGWP